MQNPVIPAPVLNNNKITPNAVDPVMNIKEDALTKLKCAVCGLPLSVSPVTINSASAFVCGRCPAAASVNTIYEVLAENYLFPCRYQGYGCQDKIKWGSVEEHEENCLKMPFICPSLSCAWQGAIDDIAAHFTAEHFKNVCFENCITIKLDVDAESYYLIPTADAYHILHYTVTSKALQLEVSELTNHTLFEEHTFQLKLSSLDFSKQVKYTANQIKPYDWRCRSDYDKAVVKIDINSLITITDDNFVFCEIILYEEKLKIQKVLLDALECGICNENMCSEINVCFTGHSFCLTCSDKMKQCPLCKSQFGGIRNYALKDLAEKPIFSCKNKAFRCMYKDSCKNVKKHEEQCLVINVDPEVKSLLRLGFLHNQL